jgi:hypothetical protein
VDKSLLNELSSAQSTESPLVYMRFRPAWAYIDGIRDFGRFFCETTFTERAVADQACTVLQETLENAVKYSSKKVGNELELAIASDGTYLKISITSAPDANHLGNLKAELAALYSQEPEAAYLSAFERAAQDPDAASRLGLARIRYEGRADLDVTELVDGRICVTACARL